jgi:hypothetical protein
MKRELMEKRRGDYGFITCQRVGLADGAHADAIPNVAGGEGGHGAAKLDGVIHRYCVNDKENRLHVTRTAPEIGVTEAKVSWTFLRFSVENIIHDSTVRNSSEFILGRNGLVSESQL